MIDPVFYIVTHPCKDASDKKGEEIEHCFQLAQVLEIDSDIKDDNTAFFKGHDDEVDGGVIYQWLSMNQVEPLK